jgi:hypothetical protein
VNKRDSEAALDYLTRLPAAPPNDGRVIVHNTVRPSRRLGWRGFRAWLAPKDETLERCPCSWAPELGAHYRKRRGSDGGSARGP